MGMNKKLLEIGDRNYKPGTQRENLDEGTVYNFLLITVQGKV